MPGYVMGIDQSTQGTKALLFDEQGTLIKRVDLPHEQIISEDGWVSHDGEEIYQNTLRLVPRLVMASGIDKSEIKVVGISNQRETSIAWEKSSGHPIAHAIVWQCGRAKAIGDRLAAAGYREIVQNKTGIPLSPYFPAAKISWLLENIDGARAQADQQRLCYGTMDTYLLYRLTDGASYKTDYSNASRTQLFNIMELKWDEEICAMYGIDPGTLAEVCDSNSFFGETDFGGYLDQPIPIMAMLGDSHGALFGQKCHEAGLVKCTYGTGSSIMMNIGDKAILSKNGLVTSLAWGIDGKVDYVLEGNLNYTGASITWLKDDVELIGSASETEELAKKANPADTTYLVPAFTGLGAPYWANDAKALLCGMTRMTGRAEIAKATLESIAYQITDIVRAMAEDADIHIDALRVDGGPTRNAYLMQFQSDLLNMPVHVPDAEELSGIGAAYLAGIRAGIFEKEAVFSGINRVEYAPKMAEEERRVRYDGWQDAVALVLPRH